MPCHTADLLHVHVWLVFAVQARLILKTVRSLKSFFCLKLFSTCNNFHFDTCTSQNFLLLSKSWMLGSDWLLKSNQKVTCYWSIWTVSDFFGWSIIDLLKVDCKLQLNYMTVIHLPLHICSKLTENHLNELTFMASD